MKKILVSNEEKSRILESHNKVRDILMGHLFDKSLVSEQVQPLKGKELLVAAEKGCSKLKGGKIATKQNSLGQNMDALYLEATDSAKDSVSGVEKWAVGDSKYYYPDMTYEIYRKTSDGKERLIYSNSWSCSAVNVVGTDIDTRLKAMKDTAGWKEYKELTPGDQQSINANPELWLITTVGSTKLYFPKGKGQAGELSQEAIDYLNQYIGGEYGVDFKLYKDGSVEERQVWDKFTIPKGNVLSQDIVVLRDPENTTIQAALQQSQQRRQSQLIDEKTCLSVLDDWYNSYLEDPNATSAEQTRYVSVYRCYNYFKNGRYKAGRNTTNLIKALEGNSYDQNKYTAISRKSPYNVLNVVKKVKADNPRQ